MKSPNWMTEFPGAITVTDADGVILYLNHRSALSFEKEGGQSLIGRSVFDCHSPESQEKIRRILETGEPNVYTI